MENNKSATFKMSIKICDKRRSFVKVHLWHMMSNLSRHLLNIFALNSSTVGKWNFPYFKTMIISLSTSKIYLSPANAGRRWSHPKLVPLHRANLLFLRINKYKPKSNRNPTQAETKFVLAALYHCPSLGWKATTKVPPGSTTPCAP